MTLSLMSTCRWLLSIATTLVLISTASGQTVSTTELISQLSSTEPQERIAAAEQLGRSAHGDVTAAKALVTHAFDDDPAFRVACVSALIEIEAPREITMPVWLKMLQSKDNDTITQVIATIGSMGKRVVPVVRETLKNPEAAFWAVLVAEELGPDAAEATPEILALFNSTQAELQMHAVMAAGSIQGDPKIVVPALIAVLNSGATLPAKYAACFSLTQYPATSESLAALRTTWDGATDAELRLIAAWSLLTLEPNTPQRSTFLKSLIDGLTSENLAIRRLSVRALTDIKPAAEGSSPEVMEAMGRALQGADPEIVNQVVESLIARGAESLGVCRTSLGTPALQHYAVYVAKRLGKVAAPLVPDMTKLLQSNDPKLAEETAYALGAMGADAKEATAGLVAQLNNTNKQVAYAACYALGEIGPSIGPDAFKTLKQYAYSKDPFMQLSVARSLLRIDAKDPQVLALAKPVLIGGLAHENQYVRAQAVRELGSLGPKAAEAIPKLQQMKQDESALVRDEVTKALAAIQ